VITLIFISILGVLCLAAELLNARKIIYPTSIAALGVAFVYNLQLPIGDYFNGMLSIDRLFFSFSSILILVTILLIIMSNHFYQDRIENITDYIAIKIFILAGALAMVAFGNLAMFFIGIEILSISLYILVGSNKTQKESNEAAFKYFLLGSLASAILLLGIAFVYGISGSFDLSEIAHSVSIEPNNILLQIGIVLIIISLLFKASTFPFHFWAPDVYEGAPILTTAMMSTLVKIAVFGSFFKLFSIAFLPTLPFFAQILAVVSALSMTIGNLSAFKQTNVKRLLAFSGIAHAGFMLMALLHPTQGHQSILFYTTTYSLASLAVFSVAILFYKQTKNSDISAFNGLAKKQPLIAVLLTIALLSMAGIPPLAGFWAKYYLFIDLVNNYLWLVVIAILNSVASIFVYFKFIWAMYTIENENKQDFPIPKPYFFVLIFCVLALLILFIAPEIINY
jgi:NADH-quinone oxidoreductase subunit N